MKIGIITSPKADENEAFLAVLIKTQGTWRKNIIRDKEDKKREVFELKESQKNRKV